MNSYHDWFTPERQLTCIQVFVSTLFTQASSLFDFQNTVRDHLIGCGGMDTIAYLLPDPENSSMTTNVIKSHYRFTVATAKTLSPQQLPLYDKYNKANNLAATKFLLSSLDPALMSKIKEKTEDNYSFHVVWLQLIKAIQSTSIERFEDLKAAIKARHPSQYAGENLEALAADYGKDARELTVNGRTVQSQPHITHHAQDLSFGRRSQK